MDMQKVRQRFFRWKIDEEVCMLRLLFDGLYIQRKKLGWGGKLSGGYLRF